MILKSCHIENFGKLTDMTVNFSEDIHIILEENGFGKSTLAAFIRVMFYGFAGEGKKSITENERKKYYGNKSLSHERSLENRRGDRNASLSAYQCAKKSME